MLHDFIAVNGRGGNPKQRVSGREVMKGNVAHVARVLGGVFELVCGPKIDTAQQDSAAMKTTDTVPSDGVRNMGQLDSVVPSHSTSINTTFASPKEPEPEQPSLYDSWDAQLVKDTFLSQEPPSLVDDLEFAKLLRAVEAR